MLLTSGASAISAHSIYSHVTNDEVRRRTCQPPATLFITTRRLRLFSHIVRAGPHIRVFSERPSTLSHSNGNAQETCTNLYEPRLERVCERWTAGPLVSTHGDRVTDSYVLPLDDDDDDDD